MNLSEIKALSKNFLQWLESNFLPFEKNDQFALSTPFLDPFNDGIEIYVQKIGEQFIFHDAGKTLDNLLDIGIQIENSERRKNIIHNALAGTGVFFNNGRLEINTNKENQAQRLHSLIGSILRLNDLWMTSAPRNLSDFFEIVKDFFDNHDILYTSNKSISGTTIEHKIDFILPMPKGKEKLIMLIPNLTLQSAKINAFTWLDLNAAVQNSEKIILINDLFSNNENEFLSQKPIQDNALSILRAYSDKQLLWSTAKNDRSFIQQLKVNSN